MHGPVVTMPTALEASSGFPRSHSTSNLPSLPILPPLDINLPAVNQAQDLPRSASFNQLPSFTNPFSDKDKQGQPPSPDNTPSTPLADDKLSTVTTIQEGKPWDVTTSELPEKQERFGRRKSLVIRSKSWVQKARGSPERQNAQEPVPPIPADVPPVPTITKTGRERNKSVSGTLASLARKSWITSSRSPSPSPSRAKINGNKHSEEPPLKAPPKTVSESRSPGSLGPLSQLGSLPHLSQGLSDETSNDAQLQKLNPGLDAAMLNPVAQSEHSSTSSLPLSSVENHSSSEKGTALRGIEKIQQLTHTIPARKDELYSAFRSIDNDYMKFQSKAMSLKTNVVRSSLLPFLRNYATHPSNQNLRPEDVERRVEILNKWWGGLLELLDNRQNQSISGVDRPVILDAITGIMTRPEWRLTPALVSSAEASPNRSPDRVGLTKRKSMNSLASSGSQFLTESVFHNIRNLFVQNLLAQMCLVVEKMSLRHAPASLVIFCGKAVAFAFMFVPGIADLLVTLWKLQLETIKRVADEFGLPKRPNRIEDDEVIAGFPTHLRGLGWTSVKSMTDKLRQKVEIPIIAKHTHWDGPWLSRWSGRDTDLFYVFAKHYHLLIDDFLTPDLSFSAKARAPGFVLVEAQLLVNLDSTIHRVPAAEPPPISFDDVLSGADATAATALPLPANNPPRPMAENRLIMLIRDFMSERPLDPESARLTFAEAFSKVMQASAKRTSIFDHGACFTLCDFLEEALALFLRFHNTRCTESDFIEWPFWLEVCRKMLHSENSMTEIRLFSFIFGTWNLVTNDGPRKEAICLDWLLTEEIFNKFFTHWCPMVRAYYMRLLCWRICRDEGESGELDTKIFCTALKLLNSNWAHYLYLKNKAQELHLLPPSIEPSLPAPGRRLLIIRNDTQAPASNLFLGFDGIVASAAASGPKESAVKRHSALAELSKPDISDTAPKLTIDPTPSSNTSKRRWTFMGKMLPSSLSSSTADVSPTKGNNTKTLEDARRETAIARSTGKAMSRSRASSTESDTSPATSTHRACSFKFSLEWAPHANQAQQHKKLGMLVNAAGNRNSLNGSARRLYPPRLPSPAQAWVASNVPNMCNEVTPTDPKEANKIPATARYAGRSLAEWTLIVSECNNFAERRTGEGVPGLRWIEVPTLRVEGFRRLSG